MIVVAFAMAIVFVRFAIVKPVKSLTKAAHQISLGQAADLNADKIGRQSRNELHQLALGIDRLRRSVSIAMQKLGDDRPASSLTPASRHER
jgi:HAMP domain-containing protein